MRYLNLCMDVNSLDDISNFETDKPADLTPSSMQKRSLCYLVGVEKPKGIADWLTGTLKLLMKTQNWKKA